MLKSSLCDYSDADILICQTITINVRPDDTVDANVRVNERDKRVIYKN